MIEPTFPSSRSSSSLGVYGENRNGRLNRRASSAFAARFREAFGSRIADNTSTGAASVKVTPQTLSSGLAVTRGAATSKGSVAPQHVTQAATTPHALHYDPKVGPTITPEMYTDEMLDSVFDAEFLKNVKDPAGFIQARIARLLRSTPAVVRGPAGLDPQPLNPAHLSTLAQAKAMLQRLRELGIEAGPITDSSFSGGPFSQDYGTEQRRPYEIGGMNVGALLLLYAVHPKEVADQMVLAEWRRNGAT